MPNCIYLDYAATTPVDRQVIESILACLGEEGTFGNPASSSHQYGQAARLAVEQARSQVANLVGAKANQIVWTSGATESNNLAIKGIVKQFWRKNPGKSVHIISSVLEHKAVLDTLHYVEELGCRVTYLQPDAYGAIQPEAVRAALEEDTLLVTLMLVNNELGTVTDVASIGEIVRQHGALLHVDAAQATGKLAIDLANWSVDLLSMSAHKIYGPKGIGALYVGARATNKLQLQMHGGGHEQGLRSGTLATHQIVGMGKAYALAQTCLAEETQRIAALRNQFLSLLADLPGLTVNGGQAKTIPHILSLTFADAQFSPALLDGKLAISSTSACNSASLAPSHVLRGIGRSIDEASRTIRLSFGRFTTESDITSSVYEIRKALLV